MTSNKNTLYYNYIDKWVWLPFLLVSLIAIAFIIKGCSHNDQIIPCGKIEINATSEEFTNRNDTIFVDLKYTINFSYEYKSENLDTIEKYRTWIFGDSITLDTINKAKHKYLKAGEYEVSVVGCEGLKKLVIVKEDEIEATSGLDTTLIKTPSLKAKFDNPKSINVGDTLQLEDITEDAISRKWYLDDILVSSEKSFSHTFDRAGSYVIGLVVNDSLNSRTSSTITVTKPEKDEPKPSLEIVEKAQPSSFSEEDNSIFYTFKIKNNGKTILQNIKITGYEGEIKSLDVGKLSEKITYNYSITPNDINNKSIVSRRIVAYTIARNGEKVDDTWTTKNIEFFENVISEIDITSINSPDRFEYENVGDKIELYTINIENTGGTILRDIRIEKPSPLKCINCPDSLNDGESFQIKASYTIRQKDVNNGEIIPILVTVKTKLGNAQHSDMTKSIFLQKKSPYKCPTISKEEYAKKLKDYSNDPNKERNVVMEEFSSYTGSTIPDLVIEHKQILTIRKNKSRFNDFYPKFLEKKNVSKVVIDIMEINPTNNCINKLFIRYKYKVNDE